ncbi:MAG: recombinase family protein [bacterium]|nr:recombinase family protein [bacterium]
MKAVLYARVSSEKQAEKDLSIPAQLKALRKHAESKGYDVVRDYVDEAESARTAHRPAFQEMIAASKNRVKQFDVILVWKLSRFARNREDSIMYKSLLRKHGVQLVSINEQIDDTPTGKLFEGMIEVMDEFYSANLAQDTKRGMRESASRGYFSGGTPPIGYLIDRSEKGANGKGRFVLDENYSGVIRRIFDMALSGKGAKEITKSLNSEGLKNNRGKAWNKNGVLYILGNELYTGTLIWGRKDKSQQPIRREDNHPAIISMDQFAAVRRLVGSKSPLRAGQDRLRRITYYRR